MQSQQDHPKITWDWGTAYDMFTSLMVLHKPNRLGLRGAWAKGVRSRLPNEAREFLENSYNALVDGIAWVYSLPAPKDCETLLRELAQLPARERLDVLTLTYQTPPEVVKILRQVGERGEWDTRDREALWQASQQRKKYSLSEDELSQYLDWWADADAFGEQSLAALEAYYEAFFAEEEARIRPALREGQERAQALAERLSFPDLMEELSKGVRFEEFPDRDEWILAPSFWLDPLIVVHELDETRNMMVYGARPEDASLVPGELVPDALFSALKALADPTRLRILRYLSEEPLTPTELARRLRLRAPTVIHHLNTLRLAGLVYLTFEAKGDKRYAARHNRIDQTWNQLQTFLNQ